MYNDVIQGPFRLSYNSGIIVVYDISSRIYSCFRDYKPKSEEHFKNICHFLYLKNLKKIL